MFKKAEKYFVVRENSTQLADVSSFLVIWSVSFEYDRSAIRTSKLNQNEFIFKELSRYLHELGLLYSVVLTGDTCILDSVIALCTFLLSLF